MSLKKEIELGRARVRSDAYAMSIGEVANLYRDRELVIRPEFQRLFRWPLEKRSRLVESILLGIPLPSIFVMQRQDGIWEVIDGLQRLSTILEFMGELLDEESQEPLPPSRLTATRYLPSLEGRSFEVGEKTLTPGQRLAFKRSKLDFKILLPESDEKAKYELFDRLNSGGESPSAQEVRNCQLIMKDRSFFKWLEGMKQREDFVECALVSTRQMEEQYDMELVCRFIALVASDEEELKEMGSVDSFLTEKMLGAAENPDFDRDKYRALFERVFRCLGTALGPESFRRYDPGKGRFIGGFSVSAYEAITTGVAYNIDEWEELGTDGWRDQLRQRVIDLWGLQEFRTQARGGVRGTTRIPAIVVAAKKHFRPMGRA